MEGAARQTYGLSMGATETELTDLTIADTAAAIRDGLSPIDLAQAHLDRIAELDPQLKAFVEVTAERALSDARRAAGELAAGNDRGPLHGVPIALKDLVDTAGITTAGGAKIYADRVPAADARVAQRLAQAGSVLLGKTATHELAFGVTTDSPHYGRTRNPHDPQRIPGGSSGGSAAAVAARCATAAIGTDTGGSVRIPASYCGCVGLKPTLGRVSTTGIMPLARFADCVGPLARNVEDAAIVLQAIAGYDATDCMTVAVPVPDFRAGLRDGIAGLRIGVPRSAAWGLARPPVAAAARAAVEVLAGLGAEVVEVDVPDLFEFMGEPGGPGLLSLAIEEARHHHREAWAARPEDFGEDVRAMFSSPLLDAESYNASITMHRVFAERMRAALEAADVLASPTTPLTAPPIGAETVTLGDAELPVFVASIVATVPVNYAGLPAISLPCGTDPDGLPIGLQITGRQFDEPTVLRAAAAYEAARQV